MADTTRAVWQAGWVAGNAAGVAAATASRAVDQATVRTMLAQAWERGRQAGRAERTVEDRESAGAVVADLLAGCAEISAPEWSTGNGWPAGEGYPLRDAARRAARLREAQRIADRVRLFERCAARTAVEMGRHPRWRYRGGPVDWHTGLPATSACAWLRRSRRSVGKAAA